MTGSLGDVRGDGREDAKHGDCGGWGMSLMDLYGSVCARIMFQAHCETRN
jgi:hypothetical protein